MNQTTITPHTIDETIAREIEGTASQQELDALKLWVESAKENMAYYNQIHEANAYYMGKGLGKVDTDAAWSKVSTRIGSNAAPNAAAGKKPVFNIRLFSAYAAAVAAVLFAAVMLFKKTQTPQIFVSSDQNVEHELGDGSFVRLHQNSALSLVANTKREYTLKGKAAFKVKHSSEVPFIIHVDNVRIKDLGTVFTIDAMPDNDTVQVRVSEGVVQFYTMDNAGLSLKEGEEAIYVKSKNKFFKRTIDDAHPLLSISFQNADLGDVADQMSYSFRRKIVFENEALKKCNITVDFSGAEYGLVKDIIEETLNIRIENANEGTVIKGLGCQ